MNLQHPWAPLSGVPPHRKKIGLRRTILLALGFTLGVTVAAAAGISYTCDPNIDTLGPATTCNTLNTTIAGIYSSTFRNANALIYIQYGNTGLGSSTTGFLNLINYGAYRSALINAALPANGGDATDAAAVASLPNNEPAIYSSGQIEVTSALGQALGISSLVGTTQGGSACFTPGSGGCYNGIITLSTPSNLPAGQGYYYRSGAQAGNQYDIFTVVQHETDEVLGTSSCVSTTGGALSDGCGGTRASAADLFRYSAAASRVFMSPTAAYFSFDGGTTSVAPYNFTANGSDYADWTTSCTHVQDASGCLGKSLDITSNGGAEKTVLDAIGYNLAINPTPEPATMGLLGVSFLILTASKRCRRRT